jgi:hypothetical protein
MRSGRRLARVVAACALGGVAALASWGAARAQSEENLRPARGNVLAEVDRILAVVVAVRGLEPKAPIRAGLHTRESLRQVLLDKLDQEISPERLAAETRILNMLGVLEPGVDYYALLVELLTSQIAGFYDEETGELFLLDDLPADMQAPTLAHELFHGIQDQLYGIRQVRPNWPEADDAMLAATALLEGDAVGLMIDYSFGGSLSFTDIPNFMALLEGQLGGVAELAPVGDVAIPSFLQEELLFPYVGGLAFVHYLKSAGGWAAVDRAYRDPPLSTEQVLHPERYVDRDEPTWLTLDLSVLEATGLERRYDSVFGEFRWRALLRHGLGEEVAARAIENAAAGWDGDRFVALEGQDGVFALVVLTVWDTPRDAREFEAVLARFVGRLVGREPVVRESREHGASHRLATRDGLIVLERWGDMVLWIMYAPERSGEVRAEQWPDLVWQGRGRGPYRRPAPERAAPLADH